MSLNQSIHGEHEFGMIGQFCDRAKISIDIGAAEGLYLRVLHRYSAGCVGFEPNIAFYKHLKMCFPSARLEACALSSVSGERELRVPLVDDIPYNGFGTVEPENTLDTFPGGARQKFRIPARTLDSLDRKSVV